METITVGQINGYRVEFLHTSYNCPALRLYGYRRERVMLKHTPGPWRILCAGGRRTHQVWNGETHVASVEHTADGDLIAAAPDLLAALREGVESNMHSALCEAKILRDVTCRCWHSRARAAIAKAEGRE